MSTLAHTFPQPHAAGVGAQPGDATAPGRVRRFGLAVWHALERAGARRAQRELTRLSRQYAATQPELAAQLRDAARHAVKETM